MTPYEQLLRDPRWYAKRQEVLRFRDHTCQQCGANNHKPESDGFTTETLQFEVHHPGYDNDKKPWEYPTPFFVCLCSGCHRQLWHIRRAILKNLHTLNAEQMQAVLVLIGRLQGRCEKHELRSLEEVIQRTYAEHLAGKDDDETDEL